MKRETVILLSLGFVAMVGSLCWFLNTTFFAETKFRKLVSAPDSATLMLNPLGGKSQRIDLDSIKFQDALSRDKSDLKYVNHLRAVFYTISSVRIEVIPQNGGPFYIDVLPRENSPFASPYRYSIGECYAEFQSPSLDLLVSPHLKPVESTLPSNGPANAQSR